MNGAGGGGAAMKGAGGGAAGGSGERKRRSAWHCLQRTAIARITSAHSGQRLVGSTYPPFVDTDCPRAPQFHRNRRARGVAPGAASLLRKEAIVERQSSFKVSTLVSRRRRSARHDEPRTVPDESLIGSDVQQARDPFNARGAPSVPGEQLAVDEVDGGDGRSSAASVSAKA